MDQKKQEHRTNVCCGWFVLAV